MKVIFLDFDGVLNNGKFLFHHMSDFPDLIMEEKVELLNTLIERTGTHIVFSTSWREEFTMDGLIEILEKVGFKYRDKCVGVIPVHYDNERLEEIKAYLRENNITKFVILDDAKDEFYGKINYSTHVTCTNPNYGLTMEDVAHIIEQFETQDRLEEE